MSEPRAADGDVQGQPLDDQAGTGDYDVARDRAFIGITERHAKAIL